MPFTLSHPAAVLPFLRRGRSRGVLVASALVAGSMAPDVPYFADSLLPGAFAWGAATHRPWAVPTLDVAVTAGLAAAWHGLLREPLVALLPDRWAAAAHDLTAPRRDGLCPADAGWFALSAAVGAATHVGWDAFTHHGRAGVRLFPVLNETVVGQPLHHVLQYGSSAVALVWLAASSVRALRAALPGPGAGPGAAADAGPVPPSGPAAARPGTRSDAGTPAGAAPPARTATRTAVRPVTRPGSRPQARPAPPRRAPLRLPPLARRAALGLLAASTAAGTAHRLLRWAAQAPPGATPADAVPTACFGAGAGLAVGLTAYALAARAAGVPRPPA
ncbi:DUF4184 family protein [Streptacidiphilus sp. ASG 303]|uniref:DUF4184 family protein n=1 Tax=Streptacidiphilus sp. ASG 303 TaxID=2896847 RepID=UPI0027DEEDAE|nr:DUF4184 family protein [Streptacidiphilus sp. ASG 303]